MRSEREGRLGKTGEEAEKPLSIITGGANRPVQLRRSGGNAACDEQREKFLQELAATCNVRASARAAEVHYSTVYYWRSRDEGFCARWDQALDQGYASLEVALLEQARKAAEGEAPVAERGPAVSAMDAKLAFALLQNYQKYRGRPAEGAATRRSDLNLAIERLENALKRFVRPKKPLAQSEEAEEGGAGK